MGGSTLFSLNDAGPAAAAAAAAGSRALSRHIVDKDELTNGVSLTREGFSIGLPKIIKGDDSGKEYQRANKFIEEDSREFSEKYFNSKQCSIGSEGGSISMFGDNELIGKREIKLDTIYDFPGKTTANTDAGGDSATRYTYFKDCVYDPIQRNDFRPLKKEMYKQINEKIINISRCLARFNIEVLFNTRSDVTADISKSVTLSDKKYNANNVEVDATASVSIINGDDNDAKLANIQPLNAGTVGDNASEATYTALMKETNEATTGIYEITRLRAYRKQTANDVYGKVFGYRKRIDEILKMMREQTRDDKSRLYTVRVNESVVKELRKILAYLALIDQSNRVIEFEEKNRLYDTAKTAVETNQGTLVMLPSETLSNISGGYNIFGIPLEDNTYNLKDEQRYLYGITYYFDRDKSENPSYTRS
jgi:thioredoxin reductase